MHGCQGLLCFNYPRSFNYTTPLSSTQASVESHTTASHQSQAAGSPDRLTFREHQCVMAVRSRRVWSLVIVVCWLCRKCTACDHMAQHLVSSSLGWSIRASRSRVTHARVDADISLTDPGSSELWMILDSVQWWHPPVYMLLTYANDLIKVSFISLCVWESLSSVNLTLKFGYENHIQEAC